MENVNPGGVLNLAAGSYTVTNNSSATGQYAVAQNDPPLAVEYSIPGNTTQGFAIKPGGGQFENRGTTVLEVSPASGS